MLLDSFAAFDTGSFLIIEEILKSENYQEIFNPS